MNFLALQVMTLPPPFRVRCCFLCLRDFGSTRDAVEGLLRVEIQLWLLHYLGCLALPDSRGHGVVAKALTSQEVCIERSFLWRLTCVGEIHVFAFQSVACSPPPSPRPHTHVLRTLRSRRCGPSWCGLSRRCGLIDRLIDRRWHQGIDRVLLWFSGWRRMPCLPRLRWWSTRRVSTRMFSHS